MSVILMSVFVSVLGVVKIFWNKTRVLVDRFVKVFILKNGDLRLKTTSEGMGLLPSSFERELDSFLAGHLIEFVASDTENSLHVSVWCYPHAATYSISCNFGGKVINASGRIKQVGKKSLQDGNLQLEILEEFRRIRLTYVGTGIVDGGEEIFLKFHFYFQPLATHLRNQEQWSQFGCLIGKIYYTPDGSDLFAEASEKEVNLKGVRSRRVWKEKAVPSPKMEDDLLEPKMRVIKRLEAKTSLLMVGQAGRLVAVDSRTPGFFSGCIFYPSKWAARIKAIEKSGPEKFLITDEFDKKEEVFVMNNMTGKLGNEDLTFVLADDHSPVSYIPRSVKRDDSDDETSDGAEDASCDILRLDQRSCENADLVGGKGASLSRMTRLGYQVPPGLCLTAKLWQKTVAQLAVVDQAISAVEAVFNSATATTAEEDKACSEAVACISSCGAADSIAAAMESAAKDTFTDIWSERLAIRSSGLGEDGEQASCAGQNDTFLGVTGKENVLRSIELCWASLYSTRSVNYRRQHGQPIRNAIGVVIQRMVPSETAGVLFTADPVSGDPRRFTITASWGLGEAVVSGSVEPDCVVVGVSASQGRTLSAVAGSKAEQVIMTDGAGSGTVTIKVEEPVKIHHKATEGDEEQKEEAQEDEDGDKDSSERELSLNDGDAVKAGAEDIKGQDDAQDKEVGDVKDKLCLSEKQVEELVEVGKTLVKDLDAGPQDIEFAFSEGQLFILQSRPITTLHRLSEWEIEHEFDSALPSSLEIVTKANLGEVMPGIASPLTRSSIVKGLDYLMQMNIVVHGSNRKIMRERTKWLLSRQHHTFLNMLDLVLMNPETKLSTITRAIDYSVFGHQVTKESWLEVAQARHGIRNDFLLNMRLGRNLFKNSVAHAHVVETLRSKRHLAENLETMSPREIFDYIDRVLLKEYASAATCHVINSEVSSVYQTIVFLVIVGGSDKAEWSADVLEHVANLLTVDGGSVESAGVPHGLQLLQEAIKNTGWKDGFLKADDCQAAVGWLQEHIPEQLADFQNRFGHRCLKEFELTSRPWGEDLSPVILTLQAMLRSEQECEKQKPGARSKPNTGNRLTDWLLEKLLLPLSHGSVMRREESKSMTIRVIHKFRRAFRALAQALVKAGKLPSEDLLFYLTYYELEQIIHENNTATVDRVQRRKKTIGKLENLQFAEIIQGDIITEAEAEVALVESEDGTTIKRLKGTPACSGKVEGTARVVTKLSDASTIQPGDILITTSTDIGWSPYFPMLAGVVTELGGLISHGAVVAREYCLPCLVGASGATTLFQTGERVRIDTHSGTIQTI